MFGMGSRRIENLLKVVFAGACVIIVPSIIFGPSGKESIISEIRNVTGVYSERELAQIERFKNEAYFVMLTRASGRHHISRRSMNKLLNGYLEMSLGVRGEVKDKMENSLFYYFEGKGKRIDESYKDRARDLGLDVSRF